MVRSFKQDLTGQKRGRRNEGRKEGSTDRRGRWAKEEEEEEEEVAEEEERRGGGGGGGGKVHLPVTFTQNKFRGGLSYGEKF